MTTVFDYIRWRGDLSFRQDPFNAIDGVIFSSLAYIRFSGRAEAEPNTVLTMAEAAEEFFTMDDCAQRCRYQNDLDLLKAAAASRRFGRAGLMRYREQFLPEEDTQFAAETWMLDDDSLLIAFRGTDNTLVGWKEDFNMCCQQTIPSQRLAQEYVREIYSEYGDPMRLCGHSKGGNLAVFAAARSSPMIQEWIVDIYNNDGPGFSDYLMGDPGYLAMVPRIHSFVPQSSVIGMLMEHEEPIHIIRSGQISGVLQHDTFSWEVIGKELTPVAELTQDARFVRLTIQNWLLKMNLEERNQMVEALFSLLGYGNVEKALDIFQPKNLRNYIKLFGSDDTIRRVLSTEFENLVDAAWQSWKEPETQLAVSEEPKE